MKLPNFFIAGAPKAGTTSLYHYLDQHPQIYMSPVKEPNYFASEIRVQRFSEALQEKVRRDQHAMREYLSGPMSEKRFGAVGLEWGEYLRLFEQATDETAIGEASVCYLWSQSAARNIFEKVPNAKIVMILRDPADRAFSQYMHGVNKGVIRDSFRSYVDRDLRHGGECFDVMLPFLEMGRYAEQVRRYLDLFLRENIRILFYEDYESDAGRAIRGLLEFLNVDPTVQIDLSEKHLVGRAAGLRMNPQDRTYLKEYYRHDIEDLAAMLGRDLTSWLQ